MDFDKRPPIPKDSFEKLTTLRDIEENPNRAMASFFGGAKNIVAAPWVLLMRIRAGENLDPGVITSTLTERLLEKCQEYRLSIETVQEVIAQNPSYQETFQEVDQRVVRYNEECQKRPYDAAVLQNLLNEIVFALEDAAKKAFHKK